MKKLLAKIVILYSALCASAALEASQATQIETYEGDTFFHSSKCEAILMIAIAKGELYASQSVDTDVNGCISKAKQETKISFDKAMRTVRKPAGREALKNYHIAFLTALEGIKPGSNESKAAYSLRMELLKSKKVEAWTRFELEQ